MHRLSIIAVALVALACNGDDSSTDVTTAADADTTEEDTAAETAETAGTDVTSTSADTTDPGDTGDPSTETGPACLQPFQPGECDDLDACTWNECAEDIADCYGPDAADGTFGGPCAAVGECVCECTGEDGCLETCTQRLATDMCTACLGGITGCQAARCLEELTACMMGG